MKSSQENDTQAKFSYFTMKVKGDLNITSGSAFINGGEGLTIKSESGAHALSAFSSKGGAMIHGLGDHFSSSLLDLSVSCKPSSYFNFIRAMSSKSIRPIFEIDGNGKFLSSFSFVRLFAFDLIHLLS